MIGMGKVTTKLKEHSITTLAEFTTFVEKRAGSSKIVWYRGCANTSYNLLPTLYRHPRISNAKGFSDLEKQIIDKFKQRSMPFIDRPITYDAEVSQWDWLFFMQHARVPTRLLDWTENPYIALYFALEGASFTRVNGKPVYSNDVCVWVLDPVTWNRSALAHISYKGEVLSTTDKSFHGYEPATDVEFMNNKPVAIYGTYNSLRIVTQRGVFIIFGKDVSPMEKLYAEPNFPQDCLTKLVIPNGRILKLLETVIAIGYTDSMVFPDLGGLAKEIKRSFGYRIENV